MVQRKMPQSALDRLDCGLSSLTGPQLIALADFIAANAPRYVVERIIDSAYEAFDRALLDKTREIR